MDSDACCTDAATISYLRVNIFQKISYLLSVSSPRAINYSMHHLLSKYSHVLRLVTALRRMKCRVKCGWIHVQQCTSKHKWIAKRESTSESLTHPYIRPTLSPFIHTGSNQPNARLQYQAIRRNVQGSMLFPITGNVH